MTHDYALVQMENGSIVAHLPDCVLVKVARECELPIMTMWDCASPLTERDHVKICPCLKFKAKGQGKGK